MTKKTHPTPPKILGEPGRRLWRQVLADYELAASELAVLECACTAYDRHAQASAILNDEGMSVLDRYGVAKLHPMCSVVRDSTTLLARCLRQLDVDLDDAAPRPARLGAKSGPRPRPARPLREVG